MARKHSQQTEPDTNQAGQPDTSIDTQEHTNGTMQPPIDTGGNGTQPAAIGNATALEKARAARKAMHGSIRTVFYVLVGVSRDGGNRDILGEGKSRRGAEKMRDGMRAATTRYYGDVEIWKCRK